MRSTRGGLFLLLTTLSAALGCETEAATDAPKTGASSKDAAAKPSAASSAAAAPSESAKAEAPAATSCKDVVTHIVEVQEKDKKEGLIRRSNAEKMEERCGKADNIKDNAEVVACIMAAADTTALGACKDMGKLLGPW